MVRNSRIEYEGSMYYFKSDGTPMKNRLTYHPDGEHIIYLDANGAMEQQGLFRFANGRDLGYANADGQGVCGVAERSEGKIRRFGM